MCFMCFLYIFLYYLYDNKGVTRLELCAPCSPQLCKLLILRSKLCAPGANIFTQISSLYIGFVSSHTFHNGGIETILNGASLPIYPSDETITSNVWSF